MHAADLPMIDPEVRSTIERMANETVPAIRAIPDHVGQLAAPVARARDYAATTVLELGEPTQVNQHVWTTNPFFPILFATYREGLDLLARSTLLKNAFAMPDVRKCFFLMTMRRHEYEVLGSELDGEMIKRGVLQTVVEFVDHDVPLAAMTLSGARAAIAGEIVLYLAGLVPERIRQIEKNRQTLRGSAELLKAQMHTLAHAAQEYRPRATPAALQDKLRTGHKELTRVKDQLAALPGTPDPDACLEQLRAILLCPEKHIRVEPVTLHVLDYGIKSGKGRPVRFLEYVYGNEKRLAFLLASMTRDMALQIWPDLDGGTIQS